VKKYGRIIIPAGIIPEKHELEAASFFAARGKDIEFLLPRFAKGVKNPDIRMDGIIWEIKSPRGKSKRTIENNYRAAQHQSENVIFDIRKIGMDENIAIAKIKREFSLRRDRIKRIKVITKSNIILDTAR
jgi:hypothetical protein